MVSVLVAFGCVEWNGANAIPLRPEISKPRTDDDLDHIDHIDPVSAVLRCAGSVRRTSYS